MKRYCPNCGKTIDSNSYCGYCGTKLADNKSNSNNNLKGFLSILIPILIVAIVISAHTNVIVNDAMEPALNQGDIVLIENTNTYGIQNFNPYTDVDIGDVVVYDATWYNNLPVIHRIIDKQHVNGSTYYLLKGDKYPVADPYLVSPEQIRSKVITINGNLIIIPKLGYITLWFRGDI